MSGGGVEKSCRPERTEELRRPAGTGFLLALPATPWLANFQLCLRHELASGARIFMISTKQHPCLPVHRTFLSGVPLEPGDWKACPTRTPARPFRVKFSRAKRTLFTQREKLYWAHLDAPGLKISKEVAPKPATGEREWSPLAARTFLQGWCNFRWPSHWRGAADGNSPRSGELGDMSPGGKAATYCRTSYRLGGGGCPPPSSHTTGRTVHVSGGSVDRRFLVWSRID